VFFEYKEGIINYRKLSQNITTILVKIWYGFWYRILPKSFTKSLLAYSFVSEGMKY